MLLATFVQTNVCVCFRRKEHPPLASGATRRTLCAVDVGPRPTTSRSPPVGNVDILLSARESVSTELIWNASVVLIFL